MGMSDWLADEHDDDMMLCMHADAMYESLMLKEIEERASVDDSFLLRLAALVRRVMHEQT